MLGDNTGPCPKDGTGVSIREFSSDVGYKEGGLESSVLEVGKADFKLFSTPPASKVLILFKCSQSLVNCRFPSPSRRLLSVVEDAPGDPRFQSSVLEDFLCGLLSLSTIFDD